MMEKITRNRTVKVVVVEKGHPEIVKEVKQKCSSKKKKMKSKFPCPHKFPVKCSKILSSRAHLKKHLNTTHRVKDFICDYDGKHFNTKDKLRLHIFQHRIYFRVNCEVCNKEYKTNQSMRKHLRAHFEQHQCDLCGQIFNYKKLLQNHVASIHQDEHEVPCNFCTRLFANNTTRDAHQKSIHRDKKINICYFKCTECPSGFEMKEELRLHSFIHFEGEIHTCLDCNQIFKKKKLLTNHMKKHELPSFQCQNCDQLFKYRSNLGKHVKEGRCKGPAVLKLESEFSPVLEAEIAKKQLLNMTVNPTRVYMNTPGPNDLGIKKEEKMDFKVIVEVKNEEVKSDSESDWNESLMETSSQRSTTKRTFKRNLPASSYQCDLCEFITDKKCRMLSHIRHHVATKRHKCKQCDKTFTNKISLHNHSMKLHGRGVFGSIEYSTKSSECSICHRVFSEERLKYHMRLHEAPTFSCDKCSKKFRSQSTLDKHVSNNHLGQRKYTCSKCGKNFKKLTILKQHEETHNPYKIYVQCEICLTMMQMKSLKLHMEIKHGNRYNEKRFACECGKAFRYEKQLEKHNEAVHEKVNRGIVYACPDCELSYSRRSELREHSFEHYTGKLFICECGMKFKKQKLLTIHSAVHKEKLWPCDVCTLTFQTRGGRRKHKSKIHSQIKIEEDYVEIPTYEIEIPTYG